MKKIISVFALAIISSNIFSQTIPNYVPQNGLVAWYPFNGNANDESGNNFNGTVTGATLASDRNNNSNKAYNFNGTSNYVGVGNFNNWDMYNATFTISTWFLSTDSTSNLQRMIIGKDSACSGDYGQFRLTLREGTYICPSSNNIGSEIDAVTKAYFVCSSPMPQAGVWNNAVLLKDDTSLSIYVNGVLISKRNRIDTITGVLYTKNYDCFFGARKSTPVCATSTGMASFFSR